MPERGVVFSFVLQPKRGSTLTTHTHVEVSDTQREREREREGEGGREREGEGGREGGNKEGEGCALLCEMKEEGRGRKNK